MTGGGGCPSLVNDTDTDTDVTGRPGRALKRIILLSLLFLSALTSLNASRLIWKWGDGDENIKYYRYQLGGEKEDGWTVVDRETTSVILDSGSFITEFHLQSSYDGIVWSESSIGTHKECLEDTGFVTLTWDNDKEYSYFRYQRDSESSGGWTQAENGEESAVLPYHKGVNTYYVQSSWDGSSWSKSGVTTYIDSLCTCDSLIWSWEAEDEGINYYRWQRDSKKDDGWTVVGSSEREKILPAYEGLNVLYVEASYDGENWSEAKAGTYIYSLTPFRTRKWEVTLKALPYAFQKINYTIENTPENRSSVYGGGISGEFRYNISSLFSLGFGISTEYYKYESFHSYFDFKAVVTAGIRIIGRDGSRNKVYLTFGGGVDSVIRNDVVWGFYPLLSYGIRDSYRLTEDIALNLSVNINHTFQNGTNVLHILPSIGVTYTWGCKAGCTGCGGGCR